MNAESMTRKEKRMLNTIFIHSVLLFGSFNLFTKTSNAKSRRRWDATLKFSGSLPEYIDEHAVYTETTKRAVRAGAQKYGIRYIGNQSNGKFKRIGCRMPIYEFYKKVEPFDHFFTRGYLKPIQAPASLVILYPGFLDQTILRLSTLTIDRTKDHDLLVDPKVKAWIETQGIALISFRDLN